jgi:multiple sugar transport system substrate-binding protein
MNRIVHLVAAGALVVAGSACGRDDDDDAGDAGDEATEEPAGGTAAEGTEAGGTAGDQTADEGSEGAASEGDAEGSITVWAMGTEGEKLEVLAKDFMAENPNVSVDVTAVPWDAAHDKIVNAIAAGEVPDVSMVGTTWMGEFAKLGGLAEVPSSIDPSAFFEGAWGTTEVDGVAYAVPWYVETRLIYYRTDLAEKGGVTEAPADWDGLTKLAQGLVDGGAEVGISLQPGGTGAWQTFMPFFWQAGGEIMDDQGNFTLDSDACVEALTFYDSFSENGLAPDAVSDVPVEAQFADGTVGAFISGPWMIGLVGDAGADPATWTVAHQPKNQSATSFVGGSNLAVLDQADNQAAGWAFVEYLSRPEVQVKWFETVADLPAVTAAWDDPALADDELLASFGDQLDEAKAPPSISTWEQIAAEGIDAQLEQVVQGNTSPEDGCAAMQQAAESIGTGQ